MKRPKLARTEIEKNIQWIAKQIIEGYFLVDIHTKLIEQNINVGTYSNFMRIIKSNRYPVLIKAFKMRERTKKIKS